ncbi:hypothetical protein BBK82_30280 [Lentzea guizhouensis]|uniref:Uncharacterized protein n=1 Tax=Lentzea guizhouensis TaxID=1586287 RepID=A0A1B2HPR2_9PSEU|nr:hypothetical protein [Lentzea guizhouensis]ANZ39696.1 hypothetical protein BBK82_30280 [Lentzea guizhouensis]
MSATVSDEHLSAVLRTFVRTASPALDAVRKSGPRDVVADTQPPHPLSLPRRALRAVAVLRVPGTTAWTRMDTARRVRWWTGPFGRLTAAVTAIPGLGGVLANRLPVQDLLGSAAQGLIVCAIAGECGVTDTDARTRLLAAVLFDRTLPTTTAEQAAEVPRADAGAPPSRGKAGLGSALWRLAQELRGIDSLLDSRPTGNRFHRLLSSLPLLGFLGHYLAERAGTRTIRKRALTWLTAHRNQDGRRLAEAR